MSTFTLRLVGTTPLLLHRVHRHEYRDEIAANPEPGETARQEAERKMFKDASGNAAVPSDWILGALRVGCERLMNVSDSIGFRLVSEVIQLPGIPLPLKSPRGDLGWAVYQSMQHSKPGSTKAIAVVAPMFREWILEIQVTVDDMSAATHGIDRDFIERAFHEAGRVGIGLFRPPKKHFGQFRVLHPG